jgi:hypothetical protein
VQVPVYLLPGPTRLLRPMIDPTLGGAVTCQPLGAAFSDLPLLSTCTGPALDPISTWIVYPNPTPTDPDTDSHSTLQATRYEPNILLHT